MMNFSYNYQFPIEDIMESLAAAGSINSVVSAIFGLAAYVFTALSLYTIAQRREIRKAWLAWIPVVNIWILGSISDQFRYVVKGENKSKRKALLVLNLIYTVIGILIVVLAVGTLIGVVNLALHHVSEARLLQELLGYVTGIAGVSLVMLAFAIAKTIFYYMALYDLFTSCEPSNNVLYLVLCIIPMVSTIALPLLLFLCREKDGGMPPRRDLPENDVPPSNWYEESRQAKEEWNREKAYPAEPWENPEE